MMRREVFIVPLFIMSIFVLSVFSSLSLGHAQEEEGTICLTPPYCSDEKQNAVGELINQDFFTAENDVSTKTLLHSVDKFHTSLFVPHIKQGRYEEALGDLKYTLNRFPNHLTALSYMGVYAAATKNFAVGVPYFEKAIRHYPGYAITRAQYGIYLVRVGRIDTGIEKLKIAIEMDPQLAYAHAWIAEAYNRSGKLALARDASSRARKLGYKGKIPGDPPEAEIAE